MSEYPPETIDVTDFTLRRPGVADAELLAEAVADNLEHLTPFMPWVNVEAMSPDFQRDYLVRMQTQWDERQDFVYLGWGPDGVLIGSFGIHARSGPEARDLGYWLTADACGHGYATRAAQALTEAALSLDGVVRVEIHCDEVNERSALVPQRLGYRFDRLIDMPKVALAESGRQMVWVFPA
jgi:RimJ/RimL family protein N-acetyltransferase